VILASEDSTPALLSVVTNSAVGTLFSGVLNLTLSISSPPTKLVQVCLTPSKAAMFGFEADEQPDNKATTLKAIRLRRNLDKITAFF
jgi:hypothetical protein